MATLVQQNLQAKNAEYVTSFDKGDLVLPPAKQYLVGQFDLVPRSSFQPRCQSASKIDHLYTIQGAPGETIN